LSRIMAMVRKGGQESGFLVLGRISSENQELYPCCKKNIATAVLAKTGESACLMPSR